jgi:hypothetical protein
MSFSPYSGHIPRCQHIKANGTQCGSPALHRKRFCYFHNRWRATSINLKRTSAARCASILELPVLEDADSIQVALMQVLRLILNRQFDSKTGGLMLYGLQIASSNLCHLDLQPRHKADVVIDPRAVSETWVGEEAWSPEDFEGEEEQEENVARACPESPSKEPTPAKGVTTETSRQPSNAATSESNQRDEAKDLQRVEVALQGAEQGNLRDLKTFFALTGIYPLRLDTAAASE